MTGRRFGATDLLSLRLSRANKRLQQTAAAGAGCSLFPVSTAAAAAEAWRSADTKDAIMRGIALAVVVLVGCAREPQPAHAPQSETPAPAQAVVQKVKPTHPPLPKPPFDLNTYEGVVADLITILDAESKALLLKTEKEDLIQFHHGWGTGIRNHYKLWSNEALVRSCNKHRDRDGKIHPDEASMIIIEGVWAVLNSQD